MQIHGRRDRLTRSWRDGLTPIVQVRHGVGGRVHIDTAVPTDMRNRNDAIATEGTLAYVADRAPEVVAVIDHDDGVLNSKGLREWSS